MIIARIQQEHSGTAHPSFHRARMYFFTRSIMLSSQTQNENPFPAMFSWKNTHRHRLEKVKLRFAVNKRLKKIRVEETYFAKLGPSDLATRVVHARALRQRGKISECVTTY